MELYILSENAKQAIKHNKMLRAKLSILYGIKSDITITNWVKTNAAQLITVQAIELIKTEGQIPMNKMYA